MDWNSLKNDSQPIFTNVSVTNNDFYNLPHQDPDRKQMNYGLFSYIDKFNGLPILPPAKITGHALRFSDYDCNIDFGTTTGIIDLMWPSNNITHQTLPPPPELQSTPGRTHFGCSFQISHRLIQRAQVLNQMSPEASTSRTVSHSDRVFNWQLGNQK